MRELLSSFEQLLGSTGVVHGADLTGRTMGYWNKPVRARAIVRPRTTRQVSEILRRCHDARQTVVVWGGGTGLVAGTDTEPGDIALSTELMREIESIDLVERAVTVQGGCVLQAVQDATAEHGLTVPLDLGARGSCSIGGNIATNAGGINVIKHGMTRDQVLGLEVVLPDGRILSSMQGMTKNNAGYDLKQLFIGSEGTLGIVTRAILRLTPAAKSKATALIGCRQFEDLPGLLNFLARQVAGSLAAFEVLWGDYYQLVTDYQGHSQLPLEPGYPFYVLVELEHTSDGPPPYCLEELLNDAAQAGMLVDAAIAASETQRRIMWEIREDTEAVTREKNSIVFDVSLRVQDMEQFVEELTQALHKMNSLSVLHAWGHLADGNLHLAVVNSCTPDGWHERTEDLVYSCVARFNGSISAEHGIGLLKRPYLSYSRNSQEIVLMQQIKRLIDPYNLLNPGKLLDMGNAR